MEAALWVAKQPSQPGTLLRPSPSTALVLALFALSNLWVALW